MIRITLEQRIDLLARLGDYILENNDDWQATVERAYAANNWFIPAFIQHAAKQQAASFLNRQVLEDTAKKYALDQPGKAVDIGIVMAGNIPLVGLHDLICSLLAGHRCRIKLSSKDEILLRKLVQVLQNWEPGLEEYIRFESMLKGCDAYIATGSNNSARYFEYYFSRFPHIIRRNRSSAALLSGNESSDDLEKLASDIYLYFGLGCRNVTKIYVPENYNFEALLHAGERYRFMEEHHKYKNNYDYQLAILILNKQYYMSNGILLLHENSQLFSPISVLNYEYYTDRELLEKKLAADSNLQCLVGDKHVDFGMAQNPAMTDFADGIDTLKFLQEL